jgi:hypothetical protein
MRNEKGTNTADQATSGDLREGRGAPLDRGSLRESYC